VTFYHRLFLPKTLAEANRRADALAVKLEQSETARKKAEADAAAVEDLRKRLHAAETSLSEHITEQSAREEAIIRRLESQSRRFVSKCPNYFDFLELAFLYLFIDQ
jgi:chromosome segregation ATPase